MYSLLRSILFQLNPELAHHWVKASGFVWPSFLVSKLTHVRSSRLEVNVSGIHFSNPVGLAAGFDKNAEMISMLYSLGFGFLELGSVTLKKCEGNPQPRIFRLPKDKSMINRMGLPNVGVDDFVSNILKSKARFPLLVNVAKAPSSVSKTPEKSIEEIIHVLQKIPEVGSIVILNLSCPNTSDGKTFESPGSFEKLAKEVALFRKEKKEARPYWIKISPDLEDDDRTKIIEKAIDHGMDGFVVGNTSTSRENLTTSKQQLQKIGHGGLSGAAITERSNQQLEKVFRQVGDSKTLVGVGGIMGLKDLAAKLARGASLFEVYTGLIYGGPLFIRRLNRGLDALCHRLGVKNYLELRGQRGVELVTKDI